MSSIHPDMALARRAHGGDNAAWREIYDATRDRVFALLAYHIGNRDEALDVLQDTYLAVVRGIDRYRGAGSLESWICGIALRRARDWKRRLLRRFKQTETIEDSPQFDQDLPHPDPDQGRRLRKALDDLPERQRSAVLLHLWMGYSFREIGASLGISESTARVHCFRGREALKAGLGVDSTEALPLQVQEQQS